MENLGVFSVLIPLFIIIMAIITKDVVVSLLSGIFLGEFVLHGFNLFEAFIALLDGFIGLFSEGWITKTVLFALLVGSIIKLLSRSGAVEGFVHYLSEKQQKLDSPKGALLLAYFIGIIIFIESSITALIAGTVARPLCDKNGVSREKLAYVCDSTSAPVCSLIPFNGWGALLLGLIVIAINDKVIKGEGVTLLIESIFYNFYSLITIVMVLFVILFNIDFGPMSKVKAHAYEEYKPKESREYTSVWAMLLPLVVLVLMVPLSLYYTGDGDILKGSGSTSVFYAVIVTLMFIYIYYRLKGYIKHKEYFDALYEGIADMIPIGFILLLAFLIGSIVKDLGTANYIASVMQEANVSAMYIPLLVFLVASLTAFSTGTSWGTFSIMMPIALGLSASFGLPTPLMIGAVISGGIFGDHVSPISDTTIISSMASGCDHISHVRTQMPYALVVALLTSLIYLYFGWITV